MTTLAPASVEASHHRSFFSHSVETLRQVDLVNAEGGMPVEFRPVTRSAPCFALQGVQTRSVSLWHTVSLSGFLTIPKVQVDVVSIRFITSGALLRNDYRGEHIGQPGRAMMVMFDSMRSAEASEGFASISGTVPITALSAAHVALEGVEDQAPLPNFMRVVDATGVPLQNLKLMMERVFQNLKAGVQTADLVFPLLEEIMIYRLLTAWPRESTAVVKQTTPRNPRPLKRAKDYIDGHLAAKLLLADVASAAGVGVRRLQLVFKTEMGKTPVEYIIDRRLDRVRADLQSSADEATPIGSIAARWGFTHMGDFSRRYRARFGEPPSLTRRTRPPAASSRSR